MTWRVLDTIRGGTTWVWFQRLQGQGGSYHRPRLATQKFKFRCNFLPFHGSEGPLFIVRSEEVSSSRSRARQLSAPRLPGTRFSSTFCTLCFTQWTVPHIRYCSPFHFRTSEVDPGSAGTALDHRAPSIGLLAVTSNLVIVIWTAIISVQERWYWWVLPESSSETALFPGLCKPSWSPWKDERLLSPPLPVLPRGLLVCLLLRKSSLVSS